MSPHPGAEPGIGDANAALDPAPTKGASVTQQSFDDVVARLDPPLLVVTAASGSEQAGCVVGFHAQCSIEPPRFAVWLSKANRTYRVALFSTHLAVHVLDAGDHALAELFGGTTGDGTDKFARCEWTPGPGGVPILAQCAHRMVLERLSMWDDGSDHVCFVGRPVDAAPGGEGPPMRVSDAAEIEPGHEADERRDAHQDYEQAAAGAGHAVDVEELEADAESDAGE
jgi:flavin reductase (DIM6/NTAB) family NADH-FMN oxidoreductase RutF